VRGSLASRRGLTDAARQFFTEWPVQLTRRCVGGHCPSSEASATSATLGDHAHEPKGIVITVGRPPRPILSVFPQ
jgi:hypothetical protein